MKKLSFSKILITIILLTAAIVIGYKVKYRFSTDYLTDQLFEAILENDTQKAKEWIEKGADVNAERGFKTSEPLLVKAIFRGNVEIITLLLNAGALVNNQEQCLPLDSSINVALGHIEYVYTPDSSRLSWPEVKKNQKRIIPLLLDRGALTKYPKIIIAVLTEDIDLVKELFNKNEVSGTLFIDKIIGASPVNYAEWESFEQAQDLMQALLFSENQEIIAYVSQKIPGIKLLMDKVNNAEPVRHPASENPK